MTRSIRPVKAVKRVLRPLIAAAAPAAANPGQAARGGQAAGG